MLYPYTTRDCMERGEKFTIKHTSYYARLSKECLFPIKKKICFFLDGSLFLKEKKGIASQNDFFWKKYQVPFELVLALPGFEQRLAAWEEGALPLS